VTRSGLGGAVIAATAFVACPCHLAITLPLAIALFGGSAIGVFLAANTSLVVGLCTVWFVAGLALGWRLLTKPPTDAESSCCPSAVQSTSSRTQPS